MEDIGNVRAIALSIACYLYANPHASDSAEGILRWWLGRDTASLDTVLRALDWLKDQGLMDEHVALDGRSRYRRATDDAGLQRAIDLLSGSAAARD
jgi:Fe2+ or Zn2+ uptake regulation protein